MMNSEKGQTFTLALIALALGSLVIAPFLGHASGMLTGSRIYGQAITEQYSADAGVEYAIWNLQSGESLELLEFTINNKEVEVTIEDEGGQRYKITSIATSANGSSTTIESDVSLFHYAIVSTGGKITIKQDRHQEDASITGDVYSTGELDGGEYVDGKIIEGAPFDIGIDLDAYKADALSGDIHPGHLIINISPYEFERPMYITGKLEIKKDVNVILEGTVYVEKNIKIENDVIITGTGNLICEEKMEIKKRVTINLDNIPVISSTTKKLEIDEGSGITGIIYAPNDKVHFDGKEDSESHVHGALIGEKVEVDKYATVTSNPELHLWAPNALHILTWEVE